MTNDLFETKIMIILFNEVFDQEFGNKKILIEKLFFEKVIL